MVMNPMRKNKHDSRGWVVEALHAHPWLPEKSCPWNCLNPNIIPQSSLGQESLVNMVHRYVSFSNKLLRIRKFLSKVAWLCEVLPILGGSSQLVSG